MFIIIKTNLKNYNNIHSELVDSFESRSDACDKMMKLLTNKNKNEFKENGLIKVYEKGYINNTPLYIYQIIQIGTVDITDDD